MHPVLFKIGGLTIYSYGFMIAIGAVAGFAYMVKQGKRQVSLTFDQANFLFLLIFIAALFGGKVFLFLENPEYYSANINKLFTGRGFVFYGSFIFAVPSMLIYFKVNKLNANKMLDVMAITTCLVHGFGRIGCFLAGCCYGVPTDSVLGIAFHDEACFAHPLHTPLHPTQLYESIYIFLIMFFLMFLRGRKQFDGQLFLLYLGLYAVGRFVIEFYRGDLSRGYAIGDHISHSQLIALSMFFIVASVYVFRKSALTRQT